MKQGTYYVTFIATDDGAGNPTDSETITITVNELNNAPVLAAIGNKNVDEEAVLSFTVTASDPYDTPSNNLTFSASGLPSGASLTASGVFSWTPTELQDGVFGSITFTVTDDGTGMLTDKEIISITVNDVNEAPVLDAIGSKNVDEEAELTFTVSASDPNDNPANGIILSATNLPDGASFTPETGLFERTPAALQQGTYNVTLTATDNGSDNLTDSKMIAALY